MTYQTKKQLLEALEDEQDRAADLEGRLKSQLDWRNQVEMSLKADGWTPVYPQGIFLSIASAIRWEAPDRKAAEALHAEELEAAKINTEIRTRRETLQTVIEALQLRDYIPFALRDITAGIANATEQGFYDADALWADLQTALTVREEKRAADKAAATEKKVAGLAAQVIAGPVSTGDLDANQLMTKHISPVRIPKSAAKKKSEGK